MPDSLANVISEYKDPVPRLGVESIKYTAKLTMKEVDLMPSTAFAHGQLAATFRMRMGRDNPEHLQSFLQSRVAGLSGGADQERAEAGAAGGGGPPSGGADLEQALAGAAGGAATVSTSPASSEGVTLKSGRRTYTLTDIETDGDFEEDDSEATLEGEEDDSEATLEGARYIQELASIMVAGEEEEEMELYLSDIE